MSVVIAVTDDIEACVALRLQVFVDEQGVAFDEEMDDLDDQAVHMIARDGDANVATARILINGDVGRIGRVCVVKSHRGTGLGAELMEAAIAELRSRSAVKKLLLSSQSYAIPFYERFGLVPVGEDFDDAGIPHRNMERVF